MAEPAETAPKEQDRLPPSTSVEAGFWSGRRVLVTGHTGFKGAWLSLWLAQLGADVTGFSVGPPTQPSLFALARVADGMHSIDGDIRDHHAVAHAVADARPEVVIHMAAQPMVRRSFAEPRLTYETNVMGTVNLLDAVRIDGRPRVVINVTTDKCYENREWEWAYREAEPMGGYDPYSSSKACSELVTSAFRSSFFADPDGPRVASARAGNVIGGGDWGQDRLVPDIIRAAVGGRPLRLRNPNSIRPWQHVINPLTGYLMLAEKLWESPDFACAWNFGPPDDDARPVGWILDRLAAAWPGGVDATVDDGPHPHEAQYLKLDSSRARGRLGWRPAVGLEAALASIAEWHLRLRDGDDMRAVTLAQIDALTR